MTSDARPANAQTPSFHVELTPVPAENRPFHTLHGAVPAPAPPHLPSHIEEDVTVHPVPRP